MSRPPIANARALARTSGHDLENDDRIRYQSARTKNGIVAPLPLTEAQAWDAAYARQVRHVVTNIRNKQQTRKAK